jgi:hypothetical protein
MRFVTFLLILAALPVGAALYRLIDLVLWPATDNSLRFHLAPIATALHAGGGALFLTLGPLQLIPALRRYRWHRIAGRVVLVAGLAAALSGIFMTLTFPVAPSNGPLLEGLRLAFGTAWAGWLVLAFLAIRAGDVPMHRAQMARAMAVAFGGATTAPLLGLFLLFGGTDTPTASALIQGAAWVLNLAIVELALMRRPIRKVALS